jgi:lysozyme
MNISQSGIDFVKNAEGLELKAYGDPVGHQTIGYGHLIKPGETFVGGITDTQAQSLLLEDLKIAEGYVNQWVTVPLNQNQFDALVDFVFNLGPGNFHTSTLLRELNQKNYAGAASEFSKWIYAGGHPLTGLIHRREGEKAMFLTPMASQ